MEIIKLKYPIKNNLVPTPKKITIKDPKKNLSLFFNALFLGKKTSGKTNSSLNWCKYCIDNNLINNIYLISNTLENNDYSYLNAKDENIFSEILSKDEFEETLKIIDEEIKAKNKHWRETRESLTSSQYNKFYKEIIKKYLYYKQIKDVVDPEELNEYELNDFEKEHLELNNYEIKPTYYNKIPSHLIYVDDMQGVFPYSNNSKLVNMVIRNRHNMTNFIFNNQSLIAVLPTIRANLNYWCIFEYLDQDVVKDIYKEVSGCFRNFEQFKQVYEYCTSEPYNFMLIEMTNVKQVRHNFDEIIKLK